MNSYGPPLRATQAVRNINTPMVGTESTVLNRSEDAISCSAMLNWTARITANEAVGMASVITASRISAGGSLSITNAPQNKTGTTRLRAIAFRATIQLNDTRRENTTMPDANRATPPVAWPRSSTD